jgi:methionyl-tRNA synthetase
MGYLSAAMEWAQKKGEPEAWRKFWQDPACKSYYFIGKDNIPFHTIIWPALLMGYNEDGDDQMQYNLPYDVPANEFLSLEGNKFSTSDNFAVWLPDYLDRYDPDPLRYYLSANMPETGDSDFSWREFVRRNNDELVATYGNLVHRVLTFTYRNFEGRVPEPGASDEADSALKSKADTVLEAVGESLAACHFREAIGSAMGLAHEANRYIDTKAPWNLLREDRTGCATVLWTALYVISALKTLLYPFLPFSSQKLHTMLGFPEKLQDDGWVVRPPVASAPLGEPIPLFTKLDDSVVAEEVARLNVQVQ